MRLLKAFLIFAVLTVALSTGWAAAETAHPASMAAASEPGQAEAHQPAAHEEHHGLPQKAIVVGHVFGLPITNSMVVTWIVAAALIIFARTATRKMQDVPSGAQNFWEWLVESLYEFLEGIIGHDLAKKTFWFFATIFIFILFTNWFGLIPGVGTVGWGVPKEGSSFMLESISSPLLRGGNADLNMTLAMAMLFFFFWTVWAFQANGAKGVFLHLFGAKGESTGLLKMLLVVIFFLVGFLEVFSILFRPVSLSFRLYGNIFAGENMLEAMSTLVPAINWLLPVPFYFMELLVGLVQALVFMLLTAVFTLLICMHEEGEHH
jgi:F-type H+-transporting ATPase subunit a